jgi:serine/threonine-protein kinase
MALPPRYTDPESIGHGGMGDVYSASDSELGRRVAVKLLAERYAGDHSSRKRFRREALAAARLSGHPHVVTIYDVGEWDGRPFIVMELVAGGTVADRIASGPVTREDALRWLGQAAEAIDAAHADGIVHRDVKSSNLLLDESGDVHVADFGIARVLDHTAGLTETGTVLGTAGYLSPEQARGQSATSASDIYSLGVVASEVLADERTPAVDRVLDEARADDPRRRFGSGRELVDALEDAVDATVPLRRRHVSRAWVAPLVVGVALLAGGALAGALLAGGDSRTETQERTVVQTRTLPGTTVDRVATVTTVVPAPGHGPKPKKEHKGQHGKD